MAVMPRLDDMRVEVEAIALRRCVELDLLDVETQLVQPVEPLVELVALVGAEGLFACELVPEGPVPPDDLLGGLLGIEPGRQPELRVDVEQLADDVRLGDVEVVAALPAAQLVVLLSGLRIDE